MLIPVRLFASRLFIALLLLATALPILGVTYLVPSDAEMIQRSDDIVVATAVTSTVERSAQHGVVTKYVLRIEEVLKGERTCGGYLTLTELGGELPGGGYSLLLSGMPVYTPGQRYLVFTDTNAEGEPRTWGLELGQFALHPDADHRLVALRNYSGGIDQGSLETYSEKLRDADRFMKYIRGIVAQTADPTPAYFIESSPATRLVENDFQALAFTRASYLTSASWRWQTAPVASVRTALTPTGANGTTAATAAFGAWNGTSGGINYSYFGQDDAAINGFSHCGNTPCGFNAFDSKNTILYNDPNNEIFPPELARGGPWTTGATHQVGGETFTTIDGGFDVVVDSISFSQCLLNVVILHELGHTMGFRHSNQNPDSSSCSPSSTTVNCTTNAVMSSGVSCSLTSLQTWDRDAVGTVYGSGPTCTPASITTQPQNKTITSGQPANVTVTAAGSANSYQWYIGNPTDTSNPVSGQTTATLTHAPNATTTYWVRVSGCNSSVADSSAVTVTVNQPTCVSPFITNQPQNQAITQGGSTFLTVGVSGTSPFSFEWFAGTPPNTSTPVGTSNPISVQPNVTTSYWVRVTGQCGSPALSNAAVVTVNPASCPDVTVGTPTATKQGNGTYLLDVTASSGTRPLTYQWFQGNAPNSGAFIGEGKQLSVPAPAIPTSYWVRVSNDCQKSANSAVVVTITPCDLLITATTDDQSISSGGSASLSVGFTSSTPATVKWYRGASGDKSNEVGTGLTFNTGPLTATTQFWAGVTNGCGEQATRTITITVGACNKPAILTTSPASPSATIGQTVTLSVNASGTATLHYEWYEGPAGNTSKKVGSDAPSFKTPALLANAKYWVKVLNSCGDASSPTIDIEVKLAKVRAVRH